MDGGIKHDDGKAPLWLVPWEVIRDHIREPAAEGMAWGLMSWVRRENGHVRAIQDSLTPRLVESAAHVLGFGMGKYDALNWEQGLRFTRVASAGLRHALWLPNEDPNDPESGLPHLSHLACNVIFAITLGCRFSCTEWDDRPAREAS